MTIESLGTIAEPAVWWWLIALIVVFFLAWLVFRGTQEPAEETAAAAAVFFVNDTRDVCAWPSAWPHTPLGGQQHAG